MDSIKFLEQVSVHHVHSWQTDSAILVKNCHQTVSTNRHEKCTTGINFIYVTLLVLIDGKEIPPPSLRNEEVHFYPSQIQTVSIASLSEPVN